MQSKYSLLVRRVWHRYMIPTWLLLNLKLTVALVLKDDHAIFDTTIGWSPFEVKTFYSWILVNSKLPSFLGLRDTAIEN